MSIKKFILFMLIYSIIVILLQFVFFKMFDNNVIKVILISGSAGIVSWLIRDKEDVK